MCYGTPAQPEIIIEKIILRFTHSTWIVFSSQKIFDDNIILHYNGTTWFSLHLYKLISRFYTCTIWNICKDFILHYTRTTWLLLHPYNLISYYYTCTTSKCCRRYRCTFHSHSLNFTTFLQLDFTFVHLCNLISLSFLLKWHISLHP